MSKPVTAESRPVNTETKSVNAELLILARESRDLTQKQLADKVGISQAEISRYESGTRSVNEEHIQRIGEVLDYPCAFFYQSGQRYGLGSSGLHHRKRKTLPAMTLNMLIAKINIIRFMLRRLLINVDIEKVTRFPQYDIDNSNGDIETIAELVRAAWKLPSGPIVDLIGAIENAGGIIHRMNFGTQKIDALVQWVVPEPPIILINDGVPGDRLRFTLAHEIGHLVMHDTPREDMEEEADAFASAFLMPARDISQDLERTTLPRLANLKPYWRVSIAALIRRARDLGQITDRQYRSLHEEMGRLGYRTREPVPIPVETPTLLKEIIEAHMDDLGYSVEDLAALVGLNEREFREDYLPQDTRLRIIKPFKKIAKA